MRAIEADWPRIGRRVATRLRLRACDQVGVDARLEGRPRIVNQGRIVIGARLHFSSKPVMSHLLAERGGLIEIGNDVSIGHGSGIAARRLIRIGDGCRLGAFLLAMDTDYHVPGDETAEAEIEAIEIGARVRIGNRVTILRGSVIGDDAVVLDGSVVSGHLSAGARVSGVPARAIRNRDTVQSHDALELRVRRVAERAFRLPRLPALTASPADLKEWDSLGTLSLLLALEEEFGISLGEDQMRDVKSLADAASVIASALERG